MFALADCNNFYASCERLFAPHLEGRPVVVLSNNDGCVIARSNEAKAIGIPMGAPYFQIEKLIRRHGVVVFSSNYTLYGDLSRRVMAVLAGFAPRYEVYSIDECFLDLFALPFDLTDYSLRIVRTVKQWTGIPVSIGIAPTKTLAKLANRLAKKGQSPAGAVLDWSRLLSPEQALASIPVEDIWGIASRSGARLRELGITNALALRDADPKRLRSIFGVVMERIVLELRGTSCLSLEIAPPPQKQIMVSRSFGDRLSAQDDLRAAVASFAARACEKLRSRRLHAQALSVFLQTSPFDTSRPGYANSLTIPLEAPSQDSHLLIGLALRGLERLYLPGYAYQKAGVLLLDLVPSGVQQGSLFAPSGADTVRSASLMAVIDRINHSFGRQALRFGSEAVSAQWRMRALLKSPAYTTRWAELPRVRAT
ncbi:MAG: Y-family DNA polymerase [Methylococcus sp.]|nr:Y-family DNA polymerase [Methylococcus sp.]